MSSSSPATSSASVLSAYEDKLIPYPTSPNGRAYIGLNKQPLMRIADGHGFYGVLLQDKERQLIQCAVCGDWMSQFGRHLEYKHGITHDEYRQRFGLNRKTALISDEGQMRCRKNLLSDPVRMKKLAAARGKNMNHDGGRGIHRGTEHSNKWGTCPLQLKTRLIEYITTNRQLPGQANTGRKLYMTLYRKFGHNFNRALEHFGLPVRKEIGGGYQTFLFPDGTRQTFNMRFYPEREAFFWMMMSKCPVLIN